MFFRYINRFSILGANMPYNIIGDAGTICWVKKNSVVLENVRRVVFFTPTNFP